MQLHGRARQEAQQQEQQQLRQMMRARDDEMNEMNWLMDRLCGATLRNKLIENGAMYLGAYSLLHFIVSKLNNHKC